MRQRGGFAKPGGAVAGLPGTRLLREGAGVPEARPFENDAGRAYEGAPAVPRLKRGRAP
jgi:hypothetical protein